MPSMISMAMRRPDGSVYLKDETATRFESQTLMEQEREEMFNGYGDHGPLTMNQSAL